MATAVESILELTTYDKAAKNDVLCQQGDVANEFYIIVSGCCCVRVQGKDKAAPPVFVGTLKELDFFGESALLGSVPSTNGNTITHTDTNTGTTIGTTTNYCVYYYYYAYYIQVIILIPPIFSLVLLL